MIDFYVYGYFKDINPNGVSVRKVTGRKFDCCGQTWYYRVGIDHGKKYYNVTVPSNGMGLGTFERLKDAKAWIEKHIDIIAEKLSTPDAIRQEMNFKELVDKEKEREWNENFES